MLGLPPPKKIELVGGHTRRPRKEITADPYAVEGEFEMGAPASREPAHIQWRAESIDGTAPFQNIQNEIEIFRFLTHDPVSILAHNSQTVQDHCLAGTDDHTSPSLIELPREFKVDVFAILFHSKSKI